MMLRLGRIIPYLWWKLCQCGLVQAQITVFPPLGVGRLFGSAPLGFLALILFAQETREESSINLNRLSPVRDQVLLGLN